MDTNTLPRELSGGKRWFNTVATGLCNYLDSGSIVGGSVGLALWTSTFHISNLALGLLGAFSSNAISAAIGALIGGYLCDKIGRKVVYNYDLLLYIVGAVIIMLVHSTPMLFVGYIITGLAVGADIPASWSMIAENSPADERGKHSGVAQAFWSLGPIFTLILSLVLAPFGLFGIRIIFLHLAIVALAAWLMRRSMPESGEWVHEKQRIQEAEHEKTNTNIKEKVSLKALFTGKNLRAIVFLTSLYGIWNLTAGTNGFFIPYIERTAGGASQSTSVIINLVYFIITLLSTLLIFMPFNDKINRKKMFAIGAVIQVIGIALFVILKVNFTISIIFEVLFGLGCGVGQQQFFQLWSGELFPTRFRSTAQGFMFFIVRIAIGIWSIFVPIITTALGIRGLSVFLTAFLLISGIIGIIAAPDTRGKTLDQIAVERKTNI